MALPGSHRGGGTDEERLAAMREVRDMIKAAVEAWCAERCIEA